jgi:hypothetical protein
MVRIRLRVILLGDTDISYRLAVHGDVHMKYRQASLAQHQQTQILIIDTYSKQLNPIGSHRKP